LVRVCVCGVTFQLFCALLYARVLTDRFRALCLKC
jgi:hypothetical protein